MNVVIIGCGVVGAVIAYELSQVEGLNITVLDKQPPAQASTGAALGVLMGIISHKIKGKAWRMRQTSIQRYESLIPELEELTNRKIPFNRQGILSLCLEGENLTEWEKLAEIRHSQGYQLEIWDIAKLKNLCPQIDEAKIIGAVYSPQDRQLDPTALTLALVDAAQQKGVNFRFGVNVLGITPPPNPLPVHGEGAYMDGERAYMDGERACVNGEGADVNGERADVSGERADVNGEGADVNGERADVNGEGGDEDVKFCYKVETTEGTIAADWFVLAAGLGSSLLSAKLNQMVDIRPVLGQALHFRLGHSLGNPDFQPVITGNDVHIVPVGDGDYWVGATVEFPPDSNANEILPNQELLETVKQQAIAFCPDLANATVIRTWSGLRPRPEGRPAPVIEKLPGFSNVLLATGHYRNGVLLAPATAYTIREMIISNSSP